MAVAPPYYTEDGADLNFAKQGGNMLGAPLVIGTNDAFDVEIEVNGLKALKIKSGAPADSLVIGATGLVAVGLAIAEVKLHVSDGDSGAAVLSDVALWVENNGRVRINLSSTDATDSALVFGSASDNFGADVAWNHDADLLLVRSNKVGASIAIRADDGIANLILSGALGSELAVFVGDVGIGQSVPTGRTHSKVADTEAIPVLVLEQLDLSEEMIEFVTTIGAGNPIEAVGATTFTPTHYIKITLPGGLTRVMEAGTFV